MARILYLIYVIAWIVGLYKVLTSSMDSTKKLLWALVIIFLGPIGTILFFVIRPDIK